MIEINFTIFGNQENPRGNPIPKIRKTGGQSWTRAVQRYDAWKKYVQEAAQPALIATAIDLREQDQRKLIKGARYLKPIGDVVEHIHMDIMIHWADETHGDAEGIYGSIADALFVQDKHLSGSFPYIHSPSGEGKVDVHIELPITSENVAFYPHRRSRHIASGRI